jgi:branched-chain amino acid transport system substrate-binding protein
MWCNSSQGVIMMRSAILALALLGGAAHAADRGITPTEIRIGASAALSGPLGPQTQDYNAGARLYFDAVNAAGGVSGRKIVYTTLDDGFDVKRAVDNTRKLIDESTFLIFNNTGTPHTAAILPLLQQSQTVLFGPVTGASAFRGRFNRLVFHVRASYATEVRHILAQLKEAGLTRVAIFYQDDPFGRTLLEELREAGQVEKVSFIAEIKVDAQQPDFDAAAREALKAEPQAIILGTGGTTFTNFVKAVRQAGARPAFYGFSVASLDVINRELKQGAHGIVLGQIMPSLRDSASPLVAEYLKLARERPGDAAPSAFQFEGFVNAKVLVEGLRRAGRNPTTESFVKGLESAGEIAYGRFAVRYSRDSHNGSTYVELGIIDDHGQLRN